MRFGECRFHLARPCISVREQVAIHTQGNGGGRVTEAPADRQYINCETGLWRKACSVLSIERSVIARRKFLGEPVWRPR